MSRAPCSCSAGGGNSDPCAGGHLGELTRYLPFELVDDVLAQTRTVQRRLRSLPSRTGVYFVLALGLFPDIGYARVWAKLCAGLTGQAGEQGVVVPVVSEKALRELRRRLGPAPLKALFEVVAGPLAQLRTPGVAFAGLRTVAFDGLNSIKVPDTDRNRGWLGRIRYQFAFAGYPAVWVMCLVETVDRDVIADLAPQPTRLGEALATAAVTLRARVAPHVPPVDADRPDHSRPARRPRGASPAGLRFRSCRGPRRP